MGNDKLNIRSQSGAALVVGLVLLLVLTVLAVATMNTAGLEVIMASNTQTSQAAFQMAETGIDVNIGTADNNRALLVAVAGAPPVCIGPTAVPDVGTFQACAQYTNESTPIPGSSTGVGTGLAAYHFDTNALGQSFRNARSNNTQSFFVPGPGGGS
jgi:type IV pilus assembly protein PilX